MFSSITIPFNISNLFIQSNDQTVLLQKIQFSKSTKLNRTKYCYVSLTIQSNISHVNVKTELNQTIQFSISHLFAFNLNVKLHNLNIRQFYLTHRQDPIRCYHSNPEWTWKQWLWKCTPHSPKLQHCWSLTIRYFSVISWILIGGVLPFCRDAVTVFYSPSQMGKTSVLDMILIHLMVRLQSLSLGKYGVPLHHWYSWVYSGRIPTMV